MHEILMLHNHYLQPGGEDVVFANEARLLESMGHRVELLVESNERLHTMSAAKAAMNTVWSKKSYRRVQERIEATQPAIAHFHNTFLMLSPSAYQACRDMGVPIVQSLHNFRLLCPAATFFRDGAVCELCMGKTPPWPAIRYGCWRNSRTHTAVVSTMLTIHRWRATWKTQVDAFIALTDFARMKFIEGGLPAERIFVKPNFVESKETPHRRTGNFLLFVGRLSAEKGIEILLKAWERLNSDIALVIAGDGPLASQVAKFAENYESVHWLGQVSPDRTAQLMQEARAIIVPSLWYEGFPMVVAEAFAAGLPVIASDLGSLSELVDHENTGLHFRPGDPDSLRECLEWVLTHRERLGTMGQAARATYEARYTPQRNYECLMEIYEKAGATPSATSTVLKE